MKLNLRNRPVISLTDLLRRRKTSLRAFIDTNGITTYGLLEERCERMGCNPPSREDFDSLFKEEWVSSPTEGVVVIEPEVVDPGITVLTEEETAPESTDEEPPAPETPKKSRRRRG